MENHLFNFSLGVFISIKRLKSIFLHFLTEKFSIGEVIIVSFGILISCQFESVIFKYINQISLTVPETAQIFILSQILKGLFKIMLIAQNIFATLFWLAKANASHQIPAPVIRALILYQRFHIIVIIQTHQIKILITFLIIFIICLFNS
jgi:hypothetical protein